MRAHVVYPVRIGTCGWSYKDWTGAFYPRGLSSGEFLSHYAQHYPVVEVDSTFYRTPSVAMVNGWRDRTPEGFGFSLKVPQIITHEKILKDVDEELEGFLAAARLLGPKLACCLLQFGYFNRSVFQDRDDFLRRLDDFLAAWPSDVPVAVEIRNKGWLGDPFADCLRRHGAAWVVADQEWMPAPITVVKTWDAVTAPFSYVRIIGNRAEVEERTKSFDRVVVDRTDQLEIDAKAIRALRERVPVLAFVNNHFAGHAPATIQQLLAMLDEMSKA